MNLGTVSKELFDMLSDFLIREIGSKSIDGITYALILREDKENYRDYMEIRKEATKCGFGTNEVFRVYEVSNGFIFDMDIQATKTISYKLSEAVSKTNGGKTPVKDFIGNSPDKRRNADMVGLARLIKKTYDSGGTIAEAALFSRNTSPLIQVSGILKRKDKNGKPQEEIVQLKYPAFAIRHWDIETINKHLLIPAKLRIAKIEPCEILPSKRGVKFNFYIEPIEEY